MLYSERNNSRSVDVSNWQVISKQKKTYAIFIILDKNGLNTSCHNDTNKNNKMLCNAKSAETFLT